MTIVFRNDGYSAQQGDGTVREAIPVFNASPAAAANVTATGASKSEDAVHGSGDTGTMFLGVRNDGSATTFTSANGDYSPIAVDNKGRVLINQAPGSGTDRSITATTTAQTLMAANTSRSGFMIKNDTAIVVWINFGGTAVAAAGSGNIAIAANGGYFECPAAWTPTEAISIIAASTTAAITAREW